ncbi:MAG: hypothetical protein JW795_10260 [Chitinivibrionales bacterium]|nr:hypothetical protein [Chitinivibrionales bacterium]
MNKRLSERIFQNWHLGFVILFALCAGYFVAFPITDTDIWWHLAAARQIITEKHFLYTDPFAFSVQNPLWIDLHWFFQLCMYVCYAIGSAYGIIAFKSICLFLCGIVIATMIPGRFFAVCTASMFGLFFFEARSLVLERPASITLVCMALYLRLFEYHRRKHTLTFMKMALILTPLQILWTNSQGLFSLGPVIAGCFAAEEVFEKSKPLWKLKCSSVKNFFYGTGRAICTALGRSPIVWITALLTAACCINPYGLQGVVFPLKLLARIDPSPENIYSLNISENTPLFSITGNDRHYVYAVLCITLFFVLTTLMRRKSLRLAHLLLWVGFGGLCFSAQRNIILYYLVMIPLCSYNAGFIYRNMLKRFGENRLPFVLIRAFAGVLVLSAYGAFLLIHTQTLALCSQTGGVSPFRVGQGSVEYLKSHPIEGALFNAMRYGGYIIWNLYPEKKVFIDGRMIIRTTAFFKQYLTVLDRPETFVAVQQRYAISHCMLPIAVFPRYLPLVRHLIVDPQWDIVYVDGESILFYRHGHHNYQVLNLDAAADVQSIREGIARRWSRNSFIRNQALQWFEELRRG